MSHKTFFLAFFAVTLLGGCGGDDPDQTSGLFDDAGPGGPGGAQGGNGGNGGDGGIGGEGGEGGSQTTNTTPLTYEEALNAECEGGCEHAAKVSTARGCEISPTCVEDCVDYGLLPQTVKCGKEYLAILECAQVEDSTATCYCGADYTLACQVCEQENVNFQGCKEFGF